MDYTRRVVSDMEDSNALSSLLFRSVSDTDIGTLDIGRVLSMEISPRCDKINECVEEVNCKDVLKNVRSLPIYYYEINDRRYIGPLVIDWNKHCGINCKKKVLIGREVNGELVEEEVVVNGCQDETIESADVMGVCLGSIKGLSEEIDIMNKRIDELEERLH